MEFNINFRGIILFGLEIRFYSVLILGGLLAGILLAQVEAKRLKDDPSHVVNIAVIGAVCALIGARLYHVIDFWSFYANNPTQIFAFREGGIGIFGAIAGAAVGLLVYVWWVNHRGRGTTRLGVLRWFDIGAPAFLIGQAVGRWGNYFNQELFGPPTELPWGITIDAINRTSAYPVTTYAIGTTFHPLFLYESLLSLAGVVFLLWVGRRFVHRLRQGDVLLLYFIWYPLERSVLELLRSDNWTIGPVAVAHIVSFMLIAAAVIALLWWPRPPYVEEGVLVRSEDKRELHLTPQSRAAQRRQRRRTEP